MEERELLDGVKELENLSEGDYRKPLAAILGNVPATEAADRMGRVVRRPTRSTLANSPTTSISDASCFRSWERSAILGATHCAARVWKTSIFRSSRTRISSGRDLSCNSALSSSTYSTGPTLAPTR